MNWDAVSAIAEAIGVIVVIASLFYIAAQIRQNSTLLKQNAELARAAMIHQTNASATQLGSLIAASEETASIYRRGKSGEPLNPDEETRYLSLVEIHLTWLEDIDKQYHEGLHFDDEDDPEPMQDMIPHYGDMLRPTIVRDWWQGGARYYFSGSFRNKIESIMAADWSASGR